MSLEIKRTHYFKVFITDEGYVINDDGMMIMHGDRDKSIQDVGESIMSEIDTMLENEECYCYGYRIDYRLTPITKNPFK